MANFWNIWTALNKGHEQGLHLLVACSIQLPSPKKKKKAGNKDGSVTSNIRMWTSTFWPNMRCHGKVNHNPVWVTNRKKQYACGSILVPRAVRWVNAMLAYLHTPVVTELRSNCLPYSEESSPLDSQVFGWPVRYLTCPPCQWGQKACSVAGCGRLWSSTRRHEVHFQQLIVFEP